MYTSVDTIHKNRWGFVDLMFCWIPSQGGFHSACPVTNPASISVTNATTISVTMSPISSIPH